MRSLLFLAALQWAAAAPTYSTLYVFTGYSEGIGGYQPYTLTAGPGGVLYGTTIEGGTGNCFPNSGCGTVFSLTPPTVAGGAWTQAMIYDFQYGATATDMDGAYPYGSIITGPKGVLYGTTMGGGAYNQGTVYQLTPPSSPNGLWTETVLYSFGASSGDAIAPGTGLVMGSHGELYGMAGYGGGSQACAPQLGCGAIFVLTPPSSSGGAWTESVIHSFIGTDGAGASLAGLVQGPSGTLYGTTPYGGTGACGTEGYSGCGVAFELAPAAGGSWTLSVLYSFTGGSDGAYPQSGVTLGANGELYGSTYGIAADCPASGHHAACGTVFSLTPPSTQGGAWSQAVLYSFDAHIAYHPEFPLVVKGKMLYGLTIAGGPGCADHGGCGTLFSLRPPATAGAAWTGKVLHDFVPTSSQPPDPSTLIRGSGGVFYGTTVYAGNSQNCYGDCGAIFELKP